MKLLLYIFLISCNTLYPFSYDTAVYKAQKGNWQDAHVALNNIVTHNPDRADVVYDAGVVAYNLGNKCQAATCFARAAECSTDKNIALCAHFNAGNLYVDEKKLEHALEEYDKALSIEPDNQYARHNRDRVAQMLQEQQQQKDNQQDQKNKDEQNQDKQEQDNKNQCGCDNQNQDQQGSDNQNGENQEQDSNDQQSSNGNDKKDTGQSQQSDGQQNQKNGSSQDESSKILQMVKTHKDKSMGTTKNNSIKMPLIMRSGMVKMSLRKNRKTNKENVISSKVINMAQLLKSNMRVMIRVMYQLKPVKSKQIREVI